MSEFTLYQINDEIKNCIQLNDDTVIGGITGEIIDTAKLESLQMERATKIKNIALWYKNLNAESDALKAEEQAFADRRKRAENKAKQLKEYLAFVLDGEKVKETQFTISYRKSKSVHVIDEKAIPADYLIPQLPKIDKVGIKKALTDGENIDGVELQESSNIQIK